MQVIRADRRQSPGLPRLAGNTGLTCGEAGPHDWTSFGGPPDGTLTPTDAKEGNATLVRQLGKETA